MAGRIGSRGSDADTESPIRESGAGGDEVSVVVDRRVFFVTVANAVLFGLGLLAAESVGEIAADVDLKPFFVTYLFLSVVRFGVPTLFVAGGSAISEGILDVVEGYELDDPIGFLGYVLGFTLYRWYLDSVAEESSRPRALTSGALLGAFLQALFEGVAILLFESSASPLSAVVSVAGNTVIHGLLLGAVPLVLLLDRFRTVLDGVFGSTAS